MHISDLTDQEFELLVEKCFADESLIESFIEHNYGDFEDTMFERGVDSDYYSDNEFWYCEHVNDDFVQFGFDKYYGGKL